MAAMPHAWACPWCSSSQASPGQALAACLSAQAACGLQNCKPSASNSQHLASTLLLLTAVPLPAVAAGLLGGQAIYLFGDYWLGLWASKPPETQQEVG